MKKLLFVLLAFLALVPAQGQLNPGVLGAAHRRNSGGGPIDPGTIGGLQIWLKPETLGSNGAPVSPWTDSSGNGNTATGGGGVDVVTNQLNGFSTARFNGFSGGLESVYRIPANVSVFYVVKLNRTAPNSAASLDTVITNRDQFTASVGMWGFLTNGFANPSGTYAFNGGFPLEFSSFLNGQSNPGANGNFPTFTFAVVSAVGPTLASSDNTMIGFANYGSGYGEIDLCELIVYDSQLSTGNRQGVEDWLGQKYGITITH